jgi:hypothetical protein
MVGIGSRREARRASQALWSTLVGGCHPVRIIIEPQVLLQMVECLECRATQRIAAASLTVSL